MSYQQRHNLANGEYNRDGHGHNLSNNFGFEGPTDDPDISTQRLCHKRALLAATLFSLGTPMLLAGDDIGHSQQGNNNAYCQDNATTWLDWLHADLNLSAFVARLLAVRRARSCLQARSWWQADAAPGQLAARWSTPRGEPLTHAEWNDGRQRALALHLSLSSVDSMHRAANADCLLLINAAPQPQTFQLPPGTWLRHIDSSSGAGADTLLPAQVTVTASSLWLASSQPLFTA